MQNLRLLSEEMFVSSMQKAVSEERNATTVVLHHLREAERRMLYAKRSYSSLMAYCIHVLGYSESAAGRRVAAMRVMVAVPEVEEKIQTGELSLATVAQAQVHFHKTHTREVEEKREVLQEIVGLSARQCERVLAEKRGETAPPEKQKPLSAGQTHVSFAIDHETAEMLKEIQIELGRTLSLSELMKAMAEIALKSLKGRKGALPQSEQKSASSRTEAGSVAQPTSEPKAQTQVNQSQKAKSATPVRVTVRREVFRRDQCCQYRDPVTGRQCGATEHLQIEHRVPRAMGGTNEVENLEVLCAAHNKLRAVQVFGVRRMQEHMMSLQ